MDWEGDTGSDEAGAEKPEWFREFEEWRFNNFMRAVEEEAGSRIGPPTGFGPDEGSGNWDFFLDWVAGGGSNNRFYGPDTRETQEMRNSTGASALRRAFYRGRCKSIDRGFGYSSGRAAWDTLINPLTAGWASTAAQVGGFAGASAINNGDGTVTFTITNVAGTHSFFYHLISDREGDIGPMTNITQTFQWTERIGSRRKSVSGEGIYE